MTRFRLSQRHVAIALLAAVVAAVLVGGLMRLRIETGVGSFLPGGDPTVRALDELGESFGGDPVVVLLESDRPAALMDQEHLPRLLGLEGRLAGLADVAVAYGPATTLNQIAIRMQNLLAEISGRRDGLIAAAEAEARTGDSSAAKKALVKFEQRYGALLVKGMPAGLPTLRNPDFVRAVVYGQSSQPKAQWRYVVPDANTVSILIRPRQGLDQTATERLVRGVHRAIKDVDLDADRVTVSGAPALAAALGGKAKHEAPLLAGLAVAAVAGCLFASRWARRRDRLIPLLAMAVATGMTLSAFGWLGRPLALSVIAFLPVLLGVGTYYAIYLAHRRHRRTVVVAGAAAAASFAMLATSPLPFVRGLGLALALGVVLSVVVGLFAARVLTPNTAPVAPATSYRPSRRLTAIAGIAVAALALAGWSVLPRLSLESDPERLAGGLPALADAQHAEELLGSSGEVDVVLTGDDVLRPEALRWLQTAEEQIVVRYGDQLRPVLSAGDLLRFLGPSPTPQQIESGTRALPSYLTGAVVRQDAKQALISFGIRLRDLDEQQEMLDGVRAALPGPPEGYSVDITGLPVAAMRGHELVSAGRYGGNLLGIAAAGLVLAIGLRRRADALRAVAAAATATGLGLLLMWVAGIALTPLTVALGSLTAAVGCEFTVLLAEAARRRDLALARSVKVAALTAVAGYSALAFSGLSVLRQFGLLLAGSVVLSLLAAMFITRLFPDRASPNRAAAEPLVAKEQHLAGVGR